MGNNPIYHITLQYYCIAIIVLHDFGRANTIAMAKYNVLLQLINLVENTITFSFETYALKTRIKSACFCYHRQYQWVFAILHNNRKSPLGNKLQNLILNIALLYYVHEFVLLVNNFPCTSQIFEKSAHNYTCEYNNKVYMV